MRLSVKSQVTAVFVKMCPEINIVPDSILKMTATN